MRQHPSGLWEARWTEYTPKGKKLRSKYFGSYKEADKKAREEAQRNFPRRLRRDNSKPTVYKPSYVYFVQPVGGGPIKIGTTAKNVQNRIATLSTGSPVPLKLLLSVLDERGDLEEMLHTHLRQYKQKGEWYEDSEEVLDAIEQVVARVIRRETWYP